MPLPKPQSKGKKVAVIGAGPAGMAVAIQLAAAGYGVTIFEWHSKISWKKLVRTTAGLEANKRGCLVVDGNDMTTRPGVYAAGDVVSGAKTVVHAVEAAQNAAQAMKRYMEG